MAPSTKPVRQAGDWKSVKWRPLAIVFRHVTTWRLSFPGLKGKNAASYPLLCFARQRLTYFGPARMRSDPYRRLFHHTDWILQQANRLEANISPWEVSYEAYGLGDMEQRTPYTQSVPTTQVRYLFVRGGARSATQRASLRRFVYGRFVIG